MRKSTEASKKNKRKHQNRQSEHPLGYIKERF